MIPSRRIGLAVISAVVTAKTEASAFAFTSLPHPTTLLSMPFRVAKTSYDEDGNPSNDSTQSYFDKEKIHPDSNRRNIIHKSLAAGGALLATRTSRASAKNFKSRTDEYEVRKSEAEWSESLSSQQYFILRQGGTEPPYSSILEAEERPGVYACAGCGTPLFDAKEKFHSGTGWPSFASPVMGTSNPSVPNVEMEDVSNIQYQLAGAEVRCRTCGGHLGDVFADGFLFVGTPAFVTGKRYCIDGGALVFVPSDQNATGREVEILRGDLPPRSGGSGRVFPG
mmetsp:Transcript_18385/g.35779  ORF Transcript_18385/g.35779 Transcript_18385/m.35779 type:complete len:281 (+) Transcript_18385:34-876(+)